MTSRAIKVGFVGAVAALVIAGFAYAGDSNHATVVINDTTRTASGTTFGARTSSNSSEYILCALTGYATSSGVTCVAVNSANVVRQCSSGATPHLDAVKAMTSYQYISFKWNTSGACTEIRAQGGSRHLP